MSHPTYQEVDLCWNETKAAIEELIVAEQRAATNELNRRVKMLSDAANVARAGMLLVGGAAGAALDAATQKFSGAMDAVAGALSGRGAAMAAGEKKIDELRRLIHKNDAWLDENAAPAAPTPSIFDDLSKRWAEMAEQTDALRDDIRSRGLDPAWVSQASSGNYTEAVNTQLSALGELAKAATNHASSCCHVVNAQRQIFEMIWNRINQCKMKAKMQTSNSEASAKAGNFFAGVAVMIEELNGLYMYLTSHGLGAWPIIGTQITFAMEASVKSVDTLSNGWPSRSEHSDAEQDPDKMVTVPARS
ncbi:hypothetical protein HMPREF1531_02477 [Propionibacterium sp. oral taxon 192 str. F0372]|uniref:hypothetical protein n=1 Tax=Propionibacterium sp. oral taxon 192 TaxID=671222 RepID=UPI000354458A|nr:hypothetical protein [Propionibacterium sp. oral taxon 192]EPH00369.1 hypothetical protein HMPREF1531_02477 [Propionibacterium sp. oral taxon 192 str. F0372]